MQVVYALVGNAVSIICAIASSLLAFHGKDGWGWFLVVSVLVFTTYGYRTEDE
jgi:hypothetical protein